jgi:hypothetical protein
MMKKTLTVGLAALMAAAMLAPASAGKAKPQVVEGTIAIPARHPDGCYTGLSRHLWSLFGEASNGAVGWTFDVDKTTWNKPFFLEATGGVGTVDLDLTYYLGDFATREEFINDPPPAAPAVSEFETHDGSGEAGKVPTGAIKAVICVFAGEGGQGAAGSSFLYQAGKGVKPSA